MSANTLAANISKTQLKINRYKRAFRAVHNKESSVTYARGWFCLGSCNVKLREFERMTLELERRAGYGAERVSVEGQP